MKGLIFTTLFACVATCAFATQEKKQLKLRIQGQNGQVDQTTIYFDNGISGNFVTDEDAAKLFSGLEGVPVIYSLSQDNRNCNINGFSALSQTETVSYGVDVDIDGQYTFTTPLFDNFDATTIVRLEDRQTGTFTDLRTNVYQADILADEPAVGRFFLHVSTPLTVASTPAGCLNNDGIVSVDAADASIQWDRAELYNSSNQVINTYTDINGVFNFDSLEAGDYFLVLTYGTYSTTKNFTITTNQIEASIEASHIYTFTQQDVDFHAIAENANRFEWDFGEGTWIIGVANPTHAFYEPGTFTVTMKCSNQYGCQANANIEIHVEQAVATGIDEADNNVVSLITMGKQVTVNLNGELSNDATVTAYNLLGQNVVNKPLTNLSTVIGFDEQPAGYYIIAIQNAGKLHTNKVFIR